MPPEAGAQQAQTAGRVAGRIFGDDENNGGRLVPKITIPRKLTRDGNIPGISAHDQTLEMGPENKFAVGGPSHYNMGWTCHTREEAAVRRYAALMEDGFKGVVILDANGDEAVELMAASSTWAKK